MDSLIPYQMLSDAYVIKSSGEQCECTRAPELPSMSLSVPCQATCVVSLLSQQKKGRCSAEKKLCSHFTNLGKAKQLALTRGHQETHLCGCMAGGLW